MKTTFNLAHFNLTNTPVVLEKIGNIALILASVGGVIIALPATLAAAGVAGFVLPALLTHIATFCLVIGTIGKSITKMFGTVDEQGKPVPTAKVEGAIK